MEELDSHLVSGVWGVGLATQRCSLDKVPLGDTEESWVLRNDGKLFHRNEEKGTITQSPVEGDVLVSHIGPDKECL